MEPNERAAFVMSQVACMLAELEAMKVANCERRYHGHTEAYGEEAFRELPDKYSLGHNDILTFLRR